MAEPTRAAEPGRFALRSPRCREGAVPGASAQRPKKKAFYLLRMKPLKEPAPNNNVSFVIHCQLGKEIKHICSNCSRGEDARDGECRGPSGRRRAREAGRWPCRGGFGGSAGVFAWRTAGTSALYPDVTPTGTLQGAAQSQARTDSVHVPVMCMSPPSKGFETVKAAPRVFFGKVGLYGICREQH